MKADLPSHSVVPSELSDVHLNRQDHYHSSENRHPGRISLIKIQGVRNKDEKIELLHEVQKVVLETVSDELQRFRH